MRIGVKFVALATLAFLLFSALSIADYPELSKLEQPVMVEGEPANVPMAVTPPLIANNELDYLGDTVHVGRTAWDMQHNATVGRMIQYDPNNEVVYVAFTDLPFGGGIRKVKFQKVYLDENGDPYAELPEAGIVNDGHWGGYVTLAMSPVAEDPLPVPCYHARVNANASYTTRAAKEWSFFDWIFIETSVPWEDDGQLIWPKSAMDGDSIVHVLSKHDGVAGIFYTRFRYNDVTEGFDITNTGGEIENVTDMAPFISADIACSPDGERVVISQPVKRVNLIPGLEDRENDKDYVYWDNWNRGLDWDWGLENAINVTNFQGPFPELEPDTLAANGDTLRLWLESQIYIDYDQELHAAFSASEYFYYTDQGYVFSQIFYWNEEDQNFIRIADGSFWNNQGASLGVNNVLVQRPSLYKDPESGWIWCVFQQFGVPGDTTQAGEARDVNEEGRPNAEIFITASPVGNFTRNEEMNGKLWFKPINITQSRSDEVAVPAGECMSERDPSISLNNDGEYLHIAYLVDRDAGAAIATTPEGQSTDNEFVYQRISKAELEEEFMNQQEWTPGFPMHVDSTNFWVDDCGWAWECNGGGDDYNLVIPIQQNYFELISTCVVPDNLNAESVFGDLGSLSIVYQVNGDIYIPGMLNTIGDIDVTQGYQLFCEENETLQIISPNLVPQNTQYTLNAGSWNWLGYPFWDEVPIETALGAAEDVIQIVQTDDGALWIPGMLNTIGNMTRGTAYFVFVSEDIVFDYNSAMMRTLKDASLVMELPEAEDAPAKTGLPYTIIVRMTDDLNALNPSTIELYDNDLLVGKGNVLDNLAFSPVIAWGGSVEHDLPGFKRDDEITLRVLASDGSILAEMKDEQLRFGKGAYADVTLDAPDASLPVAFSVDNGYPNPFNPSISVPFAVPETGEVTFSVFNVLGQNVYHSRQMFNAGHHSFVFSAASANQELVSGVYFLQVQFNSEVRTQKIMLLK